MQKKPEEVLLIQIDALASMLSAIDARAIDILNESEGYTTPKELKALRFDPIILQIDAARKIVATMKAKAKKGE